MINRRPGRCATCLSNVAAGAGEAVKISGVWEVRCPEHATGETVIEGGASVAPAHQGLTREHRNVVRSGDYAVDTRELAPAAAGDARDTGTRVDSAPAYTLLSGHPASPYQAAVFDHFKFGRGSVVVNAVAGSGKTTTMKNAVRFLDDRLHVQMFAFNVEAAGQLKAAVEELRALGDGKTYRHVRAGTFHSVGFTAIRKFLALPEGQIRVDDGKCRRILKELMYVDDEGVERFNTYGAFAVKLVGFAKGEGVGALVPDVEDRWWDLVDHHGLSLDTLDAEPAAGVAIARDLLRRSNDAAKRGWVDYDDMLYLVCLWKLRLWRNNVVIADEVQDTNAVRRAILHLSLLDGGRLYAVGDPNQSIYGFTGASTDAMDLIAREFKTRELPLSVSYRCARAVVGRAQTWVPRIEPSDAAVEGDVADDVPLHDALSRLGPEDAVLCRQTAPLVSLAYGLIARGRACRIAGREIGEGLVNLIEQQRARGIDRLVERLEAWRDRESSKFLAKGEETKAEAARDRVDCVVVIAEALPEGERTVPALIRRIRSLFDDPAEGARVVLTLSTAHKAKGREWPRVAVLRPELMPSRAARSAWAYDQELNLCYVAATRAKETLIYVRDEDMQIDPPRRREEEER